MITSIVITDKYSIGVNSNNKIKVDGHLISISEIPFIRYRFENYGQAEIDYIKSNQDKFKGPIHMAEIKLKPGCSDILESMEDMEYLVKFIYVEVDDFDIANGLKDETVELLESITDYFFDRVMIKDNSSMMYPLAAERLKIAIEQALGNTVQASDIGVCGSPLSFRHSDVEGQACLTAVWARKLMAEYSESDDIVVPSASHECMTCCGCIKYLVVNTDLPAPLSTKEKSAANSEKKVKEPKESKESKEPKKVTKLPKPKGFVDWDDI